MAQRTLAAIGLGLITALSTQMAHAGDSRELFRNDGYSIGYNAQGVAREGDQLTVEVVAALLPKWRLPLYGVSILTGDCRIRYAALGALQLHLANGDPFGRPTEEKPIGASGDDEDMMALCANARPSPPGADCALAYFRALQASGL